MPAIVLIIEKPSDWSYYADLEAITRKHGITLWSLEPKGKVGR